MKPKTFYSNGKLLLTGEYVVLDGALSLAVPTKLGQSMKVQSIDGPKIIWKSLDEKNAVWFEEAFPMETILSNAKKPKDDVLNRIIQILKETKRLNSKFLMATNGFKITTKLDFPKNWGLGSSSTLINNIANWANVDAYELLEKTFGGSGYDIACAKNDSPISYQIQDGKKMVKQVPFNPGFKDCIYFVYLNKKQNSREGIAQYKSNAADISKEISNINDITLAMIACDTLNEFQKLMDRHEAIISGIIKQMPIKQLLFEDFEGSIKSLGAWGGDFVMVASEENPSTYFSKKGFNTILKYAELIK